MSFDSDLWHNTHMGAAASAARLALICAIFALLYAVCKALLSFAALRAASARARCATRSGSSYARHAGLLLK